MKYLANMAVVQPAENGFVVTLEQHGARLTLVAPSKDALIDLLRETEFTTERPIREGLIGEAAGASAPQMEARVTRALRS